MQELVWSVVEVWQLATIFEGISDYDPKVVKKQLLKALKGPLNPTDETGSSNEGRNTLFELLLAAQFRRAGVDIKIGQDADLLIAYGEARLYIECKRPLYADNIPSNVKQPAVSCSIGLRPSGDPVSTMSEVAWPRSRSRRRSIQASKCMSLTTKKDCRV